MGQRFIVGKNTTEASLPDKNRFIVCGKAKQSPETAGKSTTAGVNLLRRSPDFFVRTRSIISLIPERTKETKKHVSSSAGISALWAALFWCIFCTTPTAPENTNATVQKSNHLRLTARLSPPSFPGERIMHIIISPMPANCETVTFSPKSTGPLILGIIAESATITDV